MAGSPLKKSVKSVNWYNLALLFKKRASKRNGVYTAFLYLIQTFTPRVISTLLRQEDHKSSKTASGLHQNLQEATRKLQELYQHALPLHVKTFLHDARHDKTDLSLKLEAKSFSKELRTVGE